jgi:hypothetical protein
MSRLPLPSRAPACWPALGRAPPRHAAPAARRLTTAHRRPPARPPAPQGALAVWRARGLALQPAGAGAGRPLVVGLLLRGIPVAAADAGGHHAPAVRRLQQRRALGRLGRRYRAGVCGRWVRRAGLLLPPPRPPPPLLRLATRARKPSCWRGWGPARGTSCASTRPELQRGPLAPVAGILIAAHADTQLFDYMAECEEMRQQKRHPHPLLESGLWRYSRHPK